MQGDGARSLSIEIIPTKDQVKYIEHILVYYEIVRFKPESERYKVEIVSDEFGKRDTPRGEGKIYKIDKSSRKWKLLHSMDTELSRKIEEKTFRHCRNALLRVALGRTLDYKR